MLATKLQYWLIGISVAIFILSCSTQVSKEIRIPDQGVFFSNLDEYGLFVENGYSPIAHDSLVAYTPINELFSDYANKDRYVYIPPGQKASLREDGHFDWPEGSILVKNFSYDETQLPASRIMETRLLIKERDKWKAVSYQWNESQQEAQLKKLGEIIPLALNQKNGVTEFDYIIPNKNQCKSCHNANEKLEPIGFRYANLDKPISHNGEPISQIEFLQRKGIIDVSTATPPNAMVAYTDPSQNLQERALAYLDINCGHCHRPAGPGNTSGLYLQYDETRSNHLGICKPPVAAGKGAGGRRFDIKAGDAENSILHYRMVTQEPGEMMPELGRALVHDEGVALIEEWINNMSASCE